MFELLERTREDTQNVISSEFDRKHWNFAPLSTYIVILPNVPYMYFVLRATTSILASSHSPCVPLKSTYTECKYHATEMDRKKNKKF
jgi:hypothetical protein